MNFRNALRIILCKLGFHTTRVWGHAEDTDANKTEYYYTCGFCDYGFWDYAVTLKRDTDMKNYVPLGTEKK